MSNQIKSTPCGIAILALLALAGSALGQNCSNGVNPMQCTPLGSCNGPDLIMGDLTGVANYVAAGDIEAFAIGTASCNIGNAPVLWIADTNQHPVIGSGMYKLTTLASGVTRFEQIGQSWLRHGFFALSESFCCTGCEATNGQSLGVHCTDPYSAALNGSQGGLGPKWQVNAHTGVIAYPPANPGFSGSVARRLQVHIADLEVSAPAARFFFSSHHLAADDAAAGNQNNNQSYRACSVTGSGTTWNASLIGSTQRTRPVLRAWADTVAGVSTAELQVDGEGLFLVAMQATDLGAGLWHYEYAVQNLNSDRSGGSFEVPMPAGVLVTNIGFHDVNYHSGDGPGNVNFSGIDWTPSMTDGSVSDGTPLVWSTQSFQQNANANALRWGTIYNFRFDADVAPTAGQVTVNLFKPPASGGPPSVVSAAGALQVPGVPSPPLCACDFNTSGGVNSADLFDFLAAFFNADPRADYNRSGAVDSQDFFEFLACFFLPPMDC